MKEKALLIAMSHLSDAQQLVQMNEPKLAERDINFVKYILLSCNGDLNQEIDPDDVWERFLER